MEAVDQRERFEAVPRELALPDPLATAMPLRISVVTPVSPPTPRKSPTRQRYSPRSQLSPGENASQTVECREAGLLRAARGPGPAEADQRIELAALSPIRAPRGRATLSRESARVVFAARQFATR